MPMAQPLLAFPSLPSRVGDDADHLQEEWSGVECLGTLAAGPACGGVFALRRLSNPEIQTICGQSFYF